MGNGNGNAEAAQTQCVYGCSSPTLPEVPRVGEDYVLNGVERPRGDQPDEYATSDDIITSVACWDMMMVLKPMMGLGALPIIDRLIANCSFQGHHSFK